MSIDHSRPAPQTTAQNSTATSTPSLPLDDFESLARKVDDAFGEAQTLPAEMRAKALSLKSAIEEFHKIGLTHIVRTLKQDEAGKEILFRLVDDPSVYALFSMHGLVRADLRTQVSRVLEMVRPYMQSHGGDVTLIDVRDKVVFVELSGNCNGCSMSQVTLKNTVEETLKQQLPEIVGVEVVVPTQSNPKGMGLVQLGVADPDAGWVVGPRVDELPTDRPFAFSSGGTEILILPSKQGLRAYRNACAHQGLPMDGGMLDLENGTVTCPWHGFQFDCHSGECFSAPQCQLEPFPLRITDQKVWVRPTIE